MRGYKSAHGGFFLFEFLRVINSAKATEINQEREDFLDGDKLMKMNLIYQ